MSRPTKIGEFGRLGAERAHDGTPADQSVEPARTSSVPPGSGRRRSAAWELTNEFIHEGFCYRISRRPLEDSDEVHLTTREQQVLSLAALGSSNKAIATRLGLAPSTIGVLLFRAATKYRVKTRADLLLAYSTNPARTPRE